MVTSMFAESVRAFAGEKVAGHLDEGKLMTAGAYRDLVRQAAGLGLTGLLIPEQYGGSDGTHRDAVAAVEELGAVDAGFAAGLSLTMTVPGLLLAAGDADQRARWLRPVAAGEAILAGAMNEPSRAGAELFDPRPGPAADFRTRAVRDGDTYVLDGAKAQWVTNAGVATDYIVFARTAPGSATAFRVPSGTPGLTTGPRSRLLGLRSGFHAEVLLDGVRVPATDRIGAEGDGLRLLVTSTPGMAVALAAVFVGVARAAYEMTLAFTGHRQSWGEPLRRHQAVALELAEMAIEVRTARLLVREAAAALDDGAPPRELAVLVPSAKTRAVDAAIRCAQSAVRLHGATGVTTGAGPEKLLRDAWTGYSCDFTRELLHLGIAANL